MSCKYCNKKLYIQAMRFINTSSDAQDLRNRVYDSVEEVYILIPNKYCPNCGEQNEQYKDSSEFWE